MDRTQAVDCDRWPANLAGAYSLDFRERVAAQVAGIVSDAPPHGLSHCAMSCKATLDGHVVAKLRAHQKK
jgi:hypothetical protein